MKLTYLPAVVLAVIIGTAIGELIHLEYGITAAAEKVQAPISKVFASKESNMSQEEFMQRLVSIVVLFVFRSLSYCFCCFSVQLLLCQ